MTRNAQQSNTDNATARDATARDTIARDTAARDATARDTIARAPTSLEKLRSLSADVRGLSTVEYVIILVLVAVLGIGVWRSLGSTIRDHVSNSNETLKGMRKSGSTED